MSNLVLPFLIPPNFSSLKLQPSKMLWISHKVHQYQGPSAIPARPFERLVIGYTSGEICVFSFRLYKHHERRMHETEVQCALRPTSLRLDVTPKLFMISDILGPSKVVLDLTTIRSKNQFVLVSCSLSILEHIRVFTTEPPL